MLNFKGSLHFKFSSFGLFWESLHDIISINDLINFKIFQKIFNNQCFIVSIILFQVKFLKKVKFLRKIAETPQISQPQICGWKPCTGGQTLNSVPETDIEKNTAESKGMTYGKHELDAVRKFSYKAWFLLAKPLNILHLCMTEQQTKLQIS